MTYLLMSYRGNWHNSKKTVTIPVVPKEGVFYDNAVQERHYYGVPLIEGSYLYFDSDRDGAHETVFVLNAESKKNGLEEEVIGIGFDYDGDSCFVPNRRQAVRRHIVASSTYLEGDIKWFLDNGYYKEILDDPLIRFNNGFMHEGMFLELTFSDSLFDIWKMKYSGSTSKLIEETKRLTSEKFVRNAHTRYGQDIFWQVTLILSAATVSIAASMIPYLGAILGPLGYFLTYWQLSSWKSVNDANKLEFYIRAHTFHNDEYEGEVTLSDMVFSDYVQDVMTDVMYGRPNAIYEPIVLETQKYKFEGQLLLAPDKVEKTTGSESILYLELDYVQQTRGYMAYSDWNDPNFYLFFSSETKNSNIRPWDIYTYEYLHMGNNIMFLEETIKKATIPEEHRNIQYDRVVPYMVSVNPQIHFTSTSTSNPVPEFYIDYPVLIDSSKDDGDVDDDESVSDEYHVIYKVFNEDSPHIRILPKGSPHELNSEIISIPINIAKLAVPEPFVESSAGYSHYI